MQISSLVRAVLLLFLLTFTPACHRKVTVTNVPAGVSTSSVTSWFAATGAFRVAGEYTKQLTTAAVSLKGDFPDDASYQRTLAALGAMDQIGIQAAQYLETVPQNWDKPVSDKVAAYLDQFAAQSSVALDDGLLHVKDSAKLQAYQTTIQLLRSTIQTIAAIVKPVQAAIGGKVGN